MKEIAGEPDKPSNDISTTSPGAIMTAPPVDSMLIPTEDEVSTISYKKYALEFVIEPLSSTQKTPVVQVVRISGANTVFGISCGMSYRAFKAIPMMKEIEMSVSHKVDGFTIVSFTKNECMYMLYFDKTMDALQYLEITNIENK